MPKPLVLLLLLLILCTPAFAQASQERTELVVFAAASMAETLTTVKNMYEAENPDITVICNFDSSGTLKTQIQQGAECDLFISASTKQLDALTDLVSRTNLLENRTVLTVPQGNPKGITSFDQIAGLLNKGEIFMAIGNSDVPVGQYTENIFSYYSINEASIAQYLTYGSNAKEVTTQIKAAAVDCGIIYATDAFSAGLEVVDIASEQMTGGRVIYPAAILGVSRNKEAALAFLQYLKTPKAMEVFKAVGFSQAL